VIIAIIAHLVLFLSLALLVPSSSTYRPPSSPASAIHAQITTQTQINQSLDAINKQQLKEKQALSRLKKEQELAKRKRQKQRKQRAAILLKKKILAQKKIKQRKEQRKRQALLAQKKRREQQVKQQKAAAQKKQQNKINQLLAQSLAEEKREINQAAQQQITAAVDRYKGEIINKISQYWIVPPDLNQGIHTIFLLKIAPGGMVLSVQMIKSSGNSVLDRSAERAIFKASPLPVPKDEALFDNFRVLRLTVRPQPNHGLAANTSPEATT
jgi:colicin import membrane protein